MTRQKGLSEAEFLSILFDDECSDNDVDDLNFPSDLNLDRNDIEINESDTDSEQEIDIPDNRAAPPPHKRMRRTLTHNRLVNSLESSLCLDNYDIVRQNAEKKNYSTILEKGNKTTPRKTIDWCNIKELSCGRQTSENVMITKGGLINGSQFANEPIDHWRLLMSDDMINLIVQCTNYQIEKKLQTIDMTAISDGNKIHLKLTNHIEINAYIGLLYARAMLNLTHHASKYLFKDIIGHPIFGATMSSNRFWFLNSNIRFDNADSRPNRFQRDRFAAFRDIFESFNDNCSSVLQPNEYLSLDETLYSCRNQISFKQYNPSKPHKYGILFKSINAVEYPFTFRTSVYSGKPLGEPGPFYTPGILPTVKSLVTSLKGHVDLKGRNISMDRLYTSYELFQ